MRAEKPEGPQEPNNRRRHKTPAARPKRGGGDGPLGFGNVMRDVRGVKRGASVDGAERGSATGSSARASTIGGTATPGSAGFDPALAQAVQLDAGAIAARAMGAVRSDGERLDHASFGVQDATTALRAQDQSPTTQAQAQPLVPTPLARMTPAALLETVLDESTKLAIDEASKDLHVELEPADLGPVVVRLRKGPDGTLDIRFRARQGDAARMLESGSELLRERLAAAGFPTVSIGVERDAELRLTGITTGR